MIQPPTICLVTIARQCELLTTERLQKDRVTTHMDHGGCEPLPVIARAALLERTARELSETTTTEFQGRDRDRPRRRPTVTTALLREQREVLAQPRLDSVKANRDRAKDAGPSWSQPCHAQRLHWCEWSKSRPPRHLDQRVLCC